MKFNVLERLVIIFLAKKERNVRKVCQDFNISRTQFYQYKKRFEDEGILGLKDKIYQRRQPRTKHSEEITERILSLVIRTPAISCSRIRKKLKKDDITLSDMGIYKTLKKHQLETRKKRWAILEQQLKTGHIEKLSAHQKLFLGSINPYFSYYQQVFEPAQYLSQDIITIQAERKKYYLYLVIDVFSHYAFARLEGEKSKGYLIKILQQAVDFLARFNHANSTVRTSDLYIFQGNESCVYQQFLSEHNFKQVQLFVRPEHDQCVEPFLDAIKPIFAEQKALTQYQHDLPNCLVEYNENYCYEYYPSYGKSAIEMLESYLENQTRWVKLSPILSKVRQRFINIPLASTKQPKKTYSKDYSLSFMAMLYSYDLFDQ